MTASEFFDLTIKVRAAQKQYYTKGRLQGDLIEAKKLESVLDNAIKHVLKYGFEVDGPVESAEQKPLFTEGQA